METRRVQITGGATFMITLPKEWAQAQKLHAGAEVELHPHAPDLLIVRPHRDSQPTRGVLPLNSKRGDALMRAFISLYVAGFDIIEVKGERITPEQRQTIRKITQALIGPEIMEESRDSIVIHNLLNLSELSAPKTLDRIFLMVHDMFGDAVRAVAEHDAELAHDIVARDEDVDRLYLMLYRQFRIVLCDLLAEEAVGVSRVQLFDTHTVARQLERVADHAVKIAQVTTALEAKPPPKIAEALRRGGDHVATLLREAVQAFRTTNPDLANQVIDTALGLEDRLMKAVKLLWDLDPHGAQLIGIACDSVRRVRDYSINIAETSLNAAAPTP
ncbi:MAG: phosphate uptake regulator PhoU [Candidatus Bipolaricaulota bacterium]|nr:phosphate uptake regulator PhoU [Candidatus Bipolaricaulota bacterium]